MMGGVGGSTNVGFRETKPEAETVTSSMKHLGLSEEFIS